MMNATRPRAGSVVWLAVGLLLGLALAGSRPQELKAGGGDRSGESIVATGPIAVRYDEGNKVQIPEDALYYLDYRAGKLKATVPTFRTSNSGSKHLEAFAERDLVSDFGLDVDNGPKPHFLMTTGQLGTMGAGWAPLFVFETTTGKAAVYRIQQAFGVRNQLRIDLLEVRSTNPSETTAGDAIAPIAR